MRQTRIDAYHAIRDKNLLSARRFSVYEAIFKHGPVTQGEVVKILAESEPSKPAHSWTPRFAELLAIGVISEHGTRECSVTKENVLEWEITDAMPKPFVRGATTSERLAEALRTIEELKQEIIDLRKKAGIGIRPTQGQLL